MNEFQIRALIIGITGSSNTAKQKLGRRFAEKLGLEPGPEGSDDGIDGFGYDEKGRRIHFQCKLRSEFIDKDDARMYYSDLKYHEIDTSIMLAGTGYKETFKQRLFGHPDITNINIHLLTLRDIFEQNDAFKLAKKDLPKLANLEDMKIAEP